MAGSPADHNGGNDTASATGPVISRQCNPNGGTTLQPLPSAPPQQCPPGTVGTYPDCRAVTIKPGRPPIVPPIVPLCPPHSHSDGRTCVCDKGFAGRPGPNPTCSPVLQIPPGVTHICPANSHWDGRTCVCNDGFTGRAGASPVCKPAIHLPPPGVTHICPTNSHWNGIACTCNDGYRGVPSRGCFKLSTNGQGNNPNGGNPKGGTPAGNNNPGRGPILNVPPKVLTLACPADSVGPHLPDCRCKPPTVGRPGHCEMPAGNPTLRIPPGVFLRNQGGSPPEVIR